MWRSAAVREFACIVVIFALATVMLHPTLRGDWPVGHDHPVHVVRIAQLKEAILTHGMPWAWSHRWFAGYPQNVIYPVGADLFVLAVQMLSFGTLNITRAYGVAFCLFYALYGYGIFYFVRRAFGSRSIGLLAAVFLLTDAGNTDVGGWFWLVDVGVWTAALGLIPALIAIVRIAAMLAKPSGRTAAAVALCVGLALLCHPIHLIYFSVAVPLICACRYLSEEPTAWRRALLLLGCALGCGLLIASFWLVPYFSAASYMSEIGTPGLALSDLGSRIVAGDLFSRMLPLAMSFGLLGSLLLLGTRSPLPLFTGMSVFVWLALSSSSYLHLFGTEIADDATNRIVFPRFLMLAKPFWYAAGAWLLVRCVKALGGGPTAAGTRAGRLVTRVALLVFAGAFVVPVLFQAASAFVRHEVLRPTEWHSKRDDRSARIAFAEWAQTEFQNTPGFFRIAHGLGEDGHRLSDLALYLPYPFYKASFTPTGHFKHNVDASSTEAFRAANVRFVLSGAPLDRDDLELITLFPPNLNVYAFKEWNPDPFVITEGAGEIELMHFDDEEIMLQAGAGSHGRLRLNVTFFPKWHATRDDVAVPITPIADPDVERSAFMEVPLLPGTYRFRYQRDVSDYAGTVLCAIGLAGCAGLASWGRLARR